MIMLYEVRCLHYIKEYLFKKWTFFSFLYNSLSNNISFALTCNVFRDFMGLDKASSSDKSKS